jgi:hypothetical protein
MYRQTNSIGAQIMNTNPNINAVDYLNKLPAKALAALIEALPNLPQTWVAVSRYERRKARTEHPDGKFDSHRRWYPSNAENCDSFTSGIRSPSAAWPMSYMLAARTMAHCLALDGGTAEAAAVLRRKIGGVAMIDAMVEAGWNAADVVRWAKAVVLADTTKAARARRWVKRPVLAEIEHEALSMIGEPAANDDTAIEEPARRRVM